MIKIMIPGVVLAAGEGSRFKGGNKLLLPFRGEPVIYHVVHEALKSKLDQVILVLGYQDERVLAALGELAQTPKLKAVKNGDWRSGRASSVRVGIAALPGEAQGALFLQGDMPLVTSELIDLVLEGLLKSGAPLCFPVYKGEKGHPVAFARELLPELARLEGDKSGLSVVKSYWDLAYKLPLEDGSTQFDLDTEEDYARLLELERTG
ncbi:MAG: nucleotidyltransferase family protein [Candidatus Bipolaricaulia bacterium]